MSANEKKTFNQTQKQSCAAMHCANRSSDVVVLCENTDLVISYIHLFYSLFNISSVHNIEFIKIEENKSVHPPLKKCP